MNQRGSVRILLIGLLLVLVVSVGIIYSRHTEILNTLSAHFTINNLTKSQPQYAQYIKNLPVEQKYVISYSDDNNPLTQLLRQKALDYLKSYIGGPLWNEQVNKLELAQTEHKVPDYQWFESNPSQYAITQNGRFLVNWTGFPRCKKDDSQPSGIDYGPNYFDENKQRCYMLYSIVVILNKNLIPEVVGISEVGGIS